MSPPAPSRAGDRRKGTSSCSVPQSRAPTSLRRRLTIASTGASGTQLAVVHGALVVAGTLSAFRDRDILEFVISPRAPRTSLIQLRMCQLQQQSLRQCWYVLPDWKPNRLSQNGEPKSREGSSSSAPGALSSVVSLGLEQPGSINKH